MVTLTLQIKLSSVQLAKKYMKRVASELDTLSGPEKEPTQEFLILQGVRFAFRVHQVILGHLFLVTCAEGVLFHIPLTKIMSTMILHW